MPSLLAVVRSQLNALEREAVAFALSPVLSPEEDRQLRRIQERIAQLRVELQMISGY